MCARGLVDDELTVAEATGPSTSAALVRGDSSEAVFKCRKPVQVWLQVGVGERNAIGVRGGTESQ
jgi:hypothetical protein